MLDPVKLQGEWEVVKMIYNSRTVIMPPTQMYWRSLGGGHLLMVESCPQGVVMGLGYDSRCWVYTGGWGYEYPRQHFLSCNPDLNLRGHSNFTKSGTLLLLWKQKIP